MTICAIYCRVSTPGQDISSQMKSLPMYAKDKGWKIYKIYSDDAISGASVDKRFNFQKLFDDTKEQKFNILLVEEHDRFLRDDNSRIRGDIIQTLKENNVELHSPSEGNCDLNTFIGEFFATIKFLLAAEERKLITRRMSRGRRKKLEKGIPMGTNKNGGGSHFWS